MIFQKFTSICPMVDEGQRIFSEGLVSLSVLLVTVVEQRTHVQNRRRYGSDPYMLYIFRHFEILLRDHVFQPSEATPDTPTDVLPKYGCILMK